MTRRELPNKPLVEAILELQWALESGTQPEVKRDPYYKFLLGSLLQSVSSEYPHHEELPTASVPDELTPHIVHHRFRVSPNGWPLLQVGPGVFTVNDTVNYRWTDFEKRINNAVPKLVSAYPKPDSLRFEVVMLRYINAIALDVVDVNVLEFLNAKMKTSLTLPDAIFSDGRIQRSPLSVASQFVFPCESPRGAVQFKFATGQRNGKPVLLFELWFTSRGPHLPRIPDGFSAWAEAAHEVIEVSFFKLIEGELEREFTGHA